MKPSISGGYRNAQGLKVRASVKAGGVTVQHNRRVLKVRSGLKSGGIDPLGGGNHSRNLLVLR